MLKVCAFLTGSPHRGALPELSPKCGKVYNLATAPHDFSVVHNTHPFFECLINLSGEVMFEQFTKKEMKIALLLTQGSSPKKNSDRTSSVA